GFAIADATPGRRPVSAVGFTLLDDRVQRTASAVPRLGYRAEQTTLFGRTMLSSPTRSRQRGSGRTRPAVAAGTVATGTVATRWGRAVVAEVTGDGIGGGRSVQARSAAHRMGDRRRGHGGLADDPPRLLGDHRRHLG